MESDETALACNQRIRWGQINIQFVPQLISDYKCTAGGFY